MSRLILLHGFTQTGASWDQFDFADRESRRPDIAPATLWDTADALAREGPGVFAGYSMGGRIALHLALAHPELVEGVVLVSTTAGIDDPSERAERKERDDSLADRIESIGAEAFLDEWLAQPMFAGLPATARSDRVTDPAALAASLRLAGTGTQEPLWARLHEITVPALVMAGERDTKYVGLAQRLVGALPDAELVIVPDAGHALHLEAPSAFVDALHAWLAAHDL